MAERQKNVVYFGHHKSGSRFFRTEVFPKFAQLNGRDVFRYEIKGTFVYDTIHDLDLHNIDFEAWAATEGAVLMLCNAGAPIVELIDGLGVDYVGVHLFRDPRQLLVSNYLDHLKRHNVISPVGWHWTKLEQDRPILEELSAEDGMIYELDNITKDIFDNQLRAWRGGDHILEFKLEEFSPDPATAQSNIEKIGAFCGFETMPEADLARTFSNGFAQHDWRELFTPKLHEKFLVEYGEMTAAMGYSNEDHLSAVNQFGAAHSIAAAERAKMDALAIKGSG